MKQSGISSSTHRGRRQRPTCPLLDEQPTHLSLTEWYDTTRTTTGHQIDWPQDGLVCTCGTSLMRVDKLSLNDF